MGRVGPRGPRLRHPGGAGRRPRRPRHDPGRAQRGAAAGGERAGRAGQEERGHPGAGRRHRLGHRTRGESGLSCGSILTALLALCISCTNYTFPVGRLEVHFRSGKEEEPMKGHVSKF